MSPRPRRDLTRFVIALGVGAVVLFLVVGGLASVGRSSGPYHASVNASFGAQAVVVATESNLLGKEVGKVVAQLPTFDRATLSDRLDLLAAEARRVADGAESIGEPSASDVGPLFHDAMSTRARAVALLRSSVEGLLALGGAGTATAGGATAPSLSPEAATRSLKSVGQMLIRADGSYRAARTAFAKVPGGSRLPASVWVSSPVLWDQGAAQTLVDQLSASPNLAPLVALHVVAVELTPAPVPPVPAIKGQPAAPPLPAGAVAVPPTCTLAVTAVVRNDGTVATAKIPVQASVQSVSGGAPFVVSRTATLGAGASAAVSLPVIAVRPSTTYTLTVTLHAPTGQQTPVGEAQATITVPTFGSAAADAACARTPAAAP